LKRILILTMSHLVGIAFGFALGIYMLPILTAPQSPSSAEVGLEAETAEFTGYFHRDLEGSDALHWGEGQIFVSGDSVSLMGRIAPGPDYRLYLTPEFADTEEKFLAVKDRSVQVGAIRTFDNFIVPVPGTVDVSRYSTVVVWCESFSQFITAAEYRPGG